MEEKVQNQLNNYFSLFEEFFKTTVICLSDCRNYAASINKYINRLRNIKSAVLTNTPLEEFQDLPNKLITRIQNLVSEDIEDIKSKLATIEELFEKLCNKNRILIETCKEIDFNDNTKLITGTPLQPPLKKLLKFAEDTITFGSHYIAQINTALEILSFKQFDTEPLDRNFTISSRWQYKSSKIIAYTQFLRENHI